MAYGEAMFLVENLGARSSWAADGSGKTPIQIHKSVTTEGLTTQKASLKYRKFPANTAICSDLPGTFPNYDVQVARTSHS
jgi:hypothetical protein